MSKSKRRKNKNKAKAAQPEKRSLNRLISKLPTGMRALPKVSSSEIGLPKMSETLIKFAEPYLDRGHGLDVFRAGVSMAAMAWNLTLLPPSRRDREIEFLFATIGPIFDGMDRATFHAMLHEMVLRKEMLFGDDLRLIAGYDVIERKDDYYVNVAAVLSRRPVAND